MEERRRGSSAVRKRVLRQADHVVVVGGRPIVWVGRDIPADSDESQIRLFQSEQERMPRTEVGSTGDDRPRWLSDRVMTMRKTGIGISNVKYTAHGRIASL